MSEDSSLATLRQIARTVSGRLVLTRTVEHAVDNHLRSLLEKAGCPICNERFESERVHFFWLLSENCQQPNILEQIAGGLGFCSAHAMYLIGRGEYRRLPRLHLPMGNVAALERGEHRMELTDLGGAMVDKYMCEAAPLIQPAAVETRVAGIIGSVKVSRYIDLFDVEGRIIRCEERAQTCEGHPARSPAPTDQLRDDHAPGQGVSPA